MSNASTLSDDDDDESDESDARERERRSFRAARTRRDRTDARRALTMSNESSTPRGNNALDASAGVVVDKYAWKKARSELLLLAGPQPLDDGGDGGDGGGDAAGDDVLGRDAAVRSVSFQARLETSASEVRMAST